MTRYQRVLQLKSEDAQTQNNNLGNALLKVVHIVLSMDCGGLERVVLDLVREGQKLGQRVEVICLERTGALALQLEALGTRVVCLDKPAGLSLQLGKKLKATLRELQPDIVHTHQIGALFYAGPAAHRAGVPVIVHTEHGKHFATRWRTRLLGRLAGRHAARFFCVSKDIADEVWACRIVPQSKIRIAANGIDTARFSEPNDRTAMRRSLNIPGMAKVVGTIGRLSEVKRQDLLIRAFAKVRPSWPDSQLLLVGDGPMKEELRRLAVALLPENSVCFAGYQAEPERYLHVMDVFALTSRSEGMPLAILEAWAAGVPVVASRVGGLPELIAEGKTGLLFGSGDEDALCNALNLILADQGLAERLRVGGRSKVQAEFTLEKMVQNYQQSYCELMAYKI